MYGEGKNWRYIIGIGLAIVLLFIVIFMIVRGGGDDAKTPETQRELTSYAEDSNFTVTHRMIGPIVAAQNHDEVEISVNNTSATVNVIKGYDGNVVDSRSYPMSTEGFREFLSALSKAGYTKGNTDEDLRNDEGNCATGQRYTFEATDGSRNMQRFWATSCGGTKTYRGNVDRTISLFQQQIPDYSDVTGDTQFLRNLKLF
jgi:hypothetical protein